MAFMLKAFLRGLSCLYLKVREKVVSCMCMGGTLLYSMIQWGSHSFAGVKPKLVSVAELLCPVGLGLILSGPPGNHMFKRGWDSKHWE